MKASLMVICIGCSVWLSAKAADESLSPSTVADAVTLAARVADLEARVQALETANSKPTQTATGKPVLWIHTEDWCAPCRVLKADIAAAKELPIEIKPAKFSDFLPGLKWTKADGTVVSRTGYRRGDLQAIIAEVLRDADPMR